MVARRDFLENIVDYILKKMNKNNYIPQDINLFKYGLNIFIRYIIFFLTIFFITSFCGNFINVLLFDFTLIVLRFHCGGYHSENIYTCFFLSVFAMAVLPQILVRININKVINFFITELFIMLQIIKKPIKNIKKIYDKQFIKKMEIRKTIILVIINIIYLFLLYYDCNLGKMVTYACGINYLSMLNVIILKWKGDNKDECVFR